MQAARTCRSTGPSSLSTIADPELFGQYSLTGYDEMFSGPGRVRPHYVALRDRLGEMGGEELASRDRAADLIMRHQGITFTVYGKAKGVEQIIPFDPIPRLIAADECQHFVTPSMASILSGARKYSVGLLLVGLLISACGRLSF